MVRWRLAEVLRAREISTYRLIQMAGVYRTQAYRIVRGELPQRVDMVLLNRLCTALDVQPGDLLEYVPDPKPRSARSRKS